VRNFFAYCGRYNRASFDDDQIRGGKSAAAVKRLDIRVQAAINFRRLQRAAERCAGDNERPSAGFLELRSAKHGQRF
jgi:hypothetical protein